VLYFDLAPEKDRKKILDQLVLQLVKTGKHLHTGFVGTEYLPHVLSEYGLHQFAGDILQKDDCPSWLYAVKLGATTVWELWDGVNEDHSFNMFTMNSLNQYGFATIGDWMVKRLAGISPLAPGYRKSRIAPQLVRGIPGVEASYETPYGRLACKLTCRDGRMTADIEIPANATAEVALPGQAVKTLGSGRYHFEYETALSFEATKYSEDSTLKQLMADPDARAYFEERDPKLARDPMVLNFAGRASILEIKKTMPNTMVPTSAYPIFDEMIDMLNRKEKER
jgi:alpha-L-rhamnosidase